jgi:hypothetical protein
VRERLVELRPEAHHCSGCDAPLDRQRAGVDDPGRSVTVETKYVATRWSASRRGPQDRYSSEQRRQLIEEARVTTEEIDGRVFTVWHLSPQSEAVTSVVFE